MTMTMDSSKSILNIASILDFISGIPMMIIGILGLTGTSIASQVPEITSELADAAPAVAAVAVIASAACLISGLLTIVEGILTRRAAKDPAKVMPVWVISLVLLVMHGITVVQNAMAGTLGISTILSVVLTGIVFYAANFMKKEMAL